MHTRSCSVFGARRTGFFSTAIAALEAQFTAQSQRRG